ncbi:MAG: hypothetical protein AB1571_02010 [Nanoarchaeota archaeon]
MLKGFDKIRKELKNFEKDRETLINNSRSIIQLSKRIIYAIHKGEVGKIASLIGEIKNKIKKIPKKSYDTDMGKVALQEYAEAVCYYEFVKYNRIPSAQELKIDIEPYLLGLFDLTGELVRKAVNDVIKKKFKDVNRIKKLVEEIYGEVLKLDLRNGELRKKSDAIKWNLKKLEDIVFSINVKEMI